MRQVIAGVVLLPMVIAACGDQPTSPATHPLYAASTSTLSEIVPLSLTTFIPCAAGGQGEDVVLEGYLHALFHVTVNAPGGVTVKSHFQPQGITGFGSVTGDKYQGTGVTQDITVLNFGATFTYVNNFRMIGQGPGNNFLVHELIHITINANGTLTVVVDQVSTECR